MRKPVLLVAGVALAATVAAQEPETVETIPVPETPAPVADEPAHLDEITVTAQKRVQSLQETPISIEVLDANEIRLRGIEGLRDLAAQVPNMTVEPFPTHNATLRLFIRGVGPTDAQLTQDPAVGVYIDGVYVARSVGLAIDVTELERIEVLRGPQGTLYGRNTTGGAVNLITQRPTLGVLSMEHEISVGERSQLSGKSMINVPLGDDVAVKLAALGHRQDGYVENTAAGGDFGDRQVSALRFDAAWDGEWLRADYSFDTYDLEYYNYMYQSVLRPNTSKGQGDLFKAYAQEHTLYSAERLTSLASGAPYEQSGTKIDGHALTLAAPLGSYELKYIGAYRDLWDAEYADLSGGTGSSRYRLDSNAYDGPAATVANGGPTPLVIPTVTQDQKSHELQFSGREFGDSLQFLLGAFYFTESAVEDRHRLNHQLSTGINPGADEPRLVNFVDLWWRIDNEARAAFGELTWTPPWLLEGITHWTVGYRHSEDRRDAVKFRISDTYVESGGSAALLSAGERFNYVSASREFTDDSFSYGAAIDLTPAVHVYAKSVEAYKSGGYNVRDPNVSGATSPQYGFGFVEGFEPEHVTSYELGTKTEWFGRTLRVNADVFHSDYRDLQINFLIPGTISDTKVRNAGAAEMDGIELDVTWLAREGLVVTANGAYLDADVEEVIDQNGNNVAHLFPFYSAPPYTGGAALDWSLWDFGWAGLRAFLGWSHVGERGGLVITEERRGLTKLEAYDVFTGRVLLEGIGLGGAGRLDLALWGRNLADEQYVISAIDNVPHADRAVIWGEPRTLGLEAIYRFD